LLAGWLVGWLARLAHEEKLQKTRDKLKKLERENDKFKLPDTHFNYILKIRARAPQSVTLNARASLLCGRAELYELNAEAS
jgi:hypothetical protein